MASREARLSGLRRATMQLVLFLELLVLPWDAGVTEVRGGEMSTFKIAYGVESA